ncbi:MAG: YIP1 family protein [Clostridia bacterium]|nr:YIP1 family protein [Clostridia bacterium]
MMKKKSFLKSLICFILIICSLYLPVSAEGYNSYTYNISGDAVASPDAYYVEKVLTGVEAGAGIYSSPSDFCLDEQGNMYIADSGNNRIVCLDSSGMFVKEYSEFILSGSVTTLSNPTGIFVGYGKMYISDTANARIIVSDLAGNVIRVLSKPTESLYPQNMAFSPGRIVVDSREKVYVLCDGVYYGAVTYDSEGKFKGFFGCNEIPVTLSLIADYAWRKILNYNQRSQLDRYLPISYSSIDIDADNFIYVCTASGDKGATAGKLNQKGSNILSEATFYETGLLTKNSYSDVASDSRGFINCLDRANRRVLQYDAEGNLLFAFGLQGSRKGGFIEPCAVATFGETVYVLDKTKCSVTKFVPTEFGSAVRTATDYYIQGQFELAIEPWKQVMEINSGYENAYLGIGKSLYFSGDYETAAEYFEIADNKEWNSKAFKEIRSVWLHKYFVYFLVGFFVLVAGLLVLNSGRCPINGKWNDFKDKFRYHSKENEKFRFALHTVFHPVDGYIELREKRRSSVLTASVIFVLTALGMMIDVQYSGFRFNTFDSRAGNLISIGIGTLLIVVMFVVANWALCVLFDSEARLKDIYCCTAYSLIPFTASLYISTVLSYVLCTDEAMIMSLISGICMFWSVLLMFFSFKEIHQYTISKTIISLLCTLIALVLVAFLLFMMFSLMQQMISFVKMAVSELSYRFS